MKKIYFLWMFSWLTITTIAQTWEQYIPVEIKNAVQAGTRTLKGVPGENYWQNHSDYFIDAFLNTDTRILTGHEKIVYHNESPDTLNYLVFRLYQNYYKKGTGRAWVIDTSDVTNGVNYKNIRVKLTDNGVNVFDKSSETPTNMIIRLKKPILPHSQATIEMDWSFRIPAISKNRMGYYGDNNFFVAYWYPQVAVYDDIDGWDRVEYYGTTEFYNDFNNFDVKITVPPQFKIWATGNLQNINKIYTKMVLKNLAKAKQSDVVTTIFTSKDCRKGKVLQNNDSKNTFHFKAEHVPDFTFGVEKFVNWQGSSLVVDTKTGRRTFVEAVYPDSLKTFDNVAYYARWSVNFMSKVIPGIPFPYPHMTVWSNGTKRGGMESPMMANDGDASSDQWAAGLSFHEIYHTYMPFYMGTNERKYAWMDEGWANFVTRFVFDSLFPDYHYFERVISTYERLSGSEKEMPQSVLSYQITDWQAYREHAYNRPSAAYNFLKETLGDSLFIQGLHYYMNTWHGKHPAPYDFFYAMEKGTGMDLKWYFKPWFLDRCYTDLSLKYFENNVVTIVNTGGIPLPVSLEITFVDGSKEKIYKKADVWKKGNQTVDITVNSTKKIKTIKLGTKEIPDINRKDNILNF